MAGQSSQTHNDESETEAIPYGTGVSAWHLAVADVMWAALAVTSQNSRLTRVTAKGHNAIQNRRVKMTDNQEKTRHPKIFV